jgi:putative ABC transport system substrate-binding protein
MQTLFKYLFTIIFILSTPLPASEPNCPIVAITQIVEHPSLNEIYKGIVDEIADLNPKIIHKSAQGNVAVASQIATLFVDQRPDVIVAITTPSAQAVVAKDSNIPVVFSAVTDPVHAKIVDKLQGQTKAITGTIDMPPIKEQLDLMQELVPNLKAIGVVYNPGEVNAVEQLKQFREIAKRRNIQVLASPATKTSEVSMATEFLTDDVQLIYVMNDNTVVSAIESVIRAAKLNNIPVVASDPSSVSRGATAALANDQYDVGRVTGLLIRKILAGTPAQDIPIVRPHKTVLVLNKKMAKTIGLSFSDVVMKKATSIID